MNPSNPNNQYYYPPQPQQQLQQQTFYQPQLQSQPINQYTSQPTMYAQQINLYTPQPLYTYTQPMQSIQPPHIPYQSMQPPHIPIQSLHYSIPTIPIQPPAIPHIQTHPNHNTLKRKILFANNDTIPMTDSSIEPPIKKHKSAPLPSLEFIKTKPLSKSTKLIKPIDITAESSDNNVGKHCKFGCGKTCNPGFTARGNPFDTCCKSCAISKGSSNHDNDCNVRNKLKHKTKKKIKIKKRIKKRIKPKPKPKRMCKTKSIGIQVLNTLNIPSEFMDFTNDKCFCNECHNNRGDNTYYFRGNPPQKYVVPIGWTRFGLDVDKGKCKMNNVWNNWHCVYHGTNMETTKAIFKCGLQLLKPGDSTIDGFKLKIKEGHINDGFKRYNKYTKKQEIFDPNQIFVSPSIKYSSMEIYAKPFDVDVDGKKVKAQCLFQLMIRPNSYSIGQETINADNDGYVIDENFNNNELEWYTKENVGIVVHGLLIKVL